MTAPERFGPYSLLKKIGRGGMAELFLARQTGVAGFERVVAIKRILPHLTEDREFVQMFVNEAKLAAQITHPNIAQIYDFGAVLGTYYIAMEYVMGKSLAAVLAQAQAKGNPIPVASALRIIARIAAGLDHAYRGATVSGAPLGIIHRDISPQNILIGYNGDIKLVDFGIAKAASTSTHTQTGVLKGKLAYLSPEQAWGKTIDHRSDLFALGIVLHEMLTGQRLFKAENEFTTLERVRTADVPVPSTVKRGLPADLDTLVLKALAKDPDNRYPTGQALEEALEDSLRRLSLPAGARELAGYLRTLFEKDIETDTLTYQQVTTITKTTPTKRQGSGPPGEHTRTLARPPTTGAPRPSPTPSPRARYAMIGLGLVAVIALTAVWAWSLLRPPAITPPAPPVASAPATPAPAVSEPTVVPQPEVLAPEPARPVPASPRPNTPAKEPTRTTKRKTVPVSTPATEPRRPTPPPAQDGRTVIPPPAPRVAAPPPALIPAVGPRTNETPKPDAPQITTRPAPERRQPSPPPASPTPPEPAHDEAPLPLLP